MRIKRLGLDGIGLVTRVGLRRIGLRRILRRIRVGISIGSRNRSRNRRLGGVVGVGGRGRSRDWRLGGVVGIGSWSRGRSRSWSRSGRTILGALILYETVGGVVDHLRDDVEVGAGLLLVVDDLDALVGAAAVQEGLDGDADGAEGGVAEGVLLLGDGDLDAVLGGEAGDGVEELGEPGGALSALVDLGVIASGTHLDVGGALSHDVALDLRSDGGAQDIRLTRRGGRRGRDP